VKLKISTVIDIPENYLIPSERFGSAVQIVFDDITNYVTVGHLSDAVKWCAEAKDYKQSTAYRIFKHHQVWGKLCAALEWDYEEIIERE